MSILKSALVTVRLKRAKEILEQIYVNHLPILKEESIDVYVDELELVLSRSAAGWVATEDYWSAGWNMMEQIKLAFDEANRDSLISLMCI